MSEVPSLLPDEEREGGSMKGCSKKHRYSLEIKKKHYQWQCKIRTSENQQEDNRGKGCGEFCQQRLVTCVISVHPTIQNNYRQWVTSQHSISKMESRRITHWQELRWDAFHNCFPNFTFSNAGYYRTFLIFDRLPKILPGMSWIVSIPN